MNTFHRNLIVVLILLVVGAPACQRQTSPLAPEASPAAADISASPTQLPEPNRDGPLSLEAALAERRSIRNFHAEPLTDAEIGQLLWAAQGVTDPKGYRSAPSAGALYPLEIYAATSEGLFRYIPEAHSLVKTLSGDPRQRLYEAALEQDSVREAPLVIVISGVYARTIAKYGENRAPRYVHLEAGHAAQNVLLQAVSLGLGAVPIGGFYETEVREALSLPNEETPLYLIPVGQPE